MERVEHYRQSIRQLLTSHATFEDGNLDIELQLVFDTEHDHYQLLAQKIFIKSDCLVQ